MPYMYDTPAEQAADEARNEARNEAGDEARDAPAAAAATAAAAAADAPVVWVAEEELRAMSLEDKIVLIKQIVDEIFPDRRVTRLLLQAQFLAGEEEEALPADVVEQVPFHFTAEAELEVRAGGQTVRVGLGAGATMEQAVEALLGQVQRLQREQGL